MEKFIDVIRLSLGAGHGGKGAVSFRRESGVPFGGPNGGDGGRGGDVVLVADQSLSSFAHLYSFHEVLAKDGEPGGGNNCHGSDGEDAVIKVPVGTVLKDTADREIHDFTVNGDAFLFLKGGLGGRGNARFATSVNQAPRYAQKGLEGDRADVVLEIKLIADIGLVGFPNAGKSTFIAAITNARPKIAPYPFTTLTPNLGIYRLDGEHSLVIADIPGIIEGAHEGKGLGLEFLRHIERTRFLFYLIDCTSDTPAEDFEVLRRELAAHSEALAAKPFAIGLSKVDLLGTAEDRVLFEGDITSKFPEELKPHLVYFSSVAHVGLETIRELGWKILRGER
ncbi:MAG: GTPase ObgE [Spirochaetes bacterium]|nr:GTPase ObgE [Spirochaetota bacterium]